MIFGISGMAIVIAGSLALYLASPQQLLVKRTLPAPILGWTGLVLVFAGLGLLLQWAGPATAVFVAFTLAMLIWTVVPLLPAWLRKPKGESK